MRLAEVVVFLIEFLHIQTRKPCGKRLQLGFGFRQSGKLSQTVKQRIQDRWSDETERVLTIRNQTQHQFLHRCFLYVTDLSSPVTYLSSVVILQTYPPKLYYRSTLLAYITYLPSSVTSQTYPIPLYHRFTLLGYMTYLPFSFTSQTYPIPLYISFMACLHSTNTSQTYPVHLYHRVTLLGYMTYLPSR